MPSEANRDQVAIPTEYRHDVETLVKRSTTANTPLSMGTSRRDSHRNRRHQQGQNIEYTRKLLTEQDITVSSAILMSRPYQQRRAYATCKELWPQLDILCASHPLTLDDYVIMINDVDRVINMLVGDTQLIGIYGAPPKHDAATQASHIADLKAIEISWASTAWI